MTPWWTPHQAAVLGGIVGSAVGILGGLFGTVVGICAPRGQCRRMVFAMTGGLISVGILSLVAGLIALLLQRPYAVYYPLLLMGGILSFSTACVVPVIRQRYREADQRRLDAEELRRGTV